MAVERAEVEWAVVERLLLDGALVAGWVFPLFVLGREPPTEYAAALDVLLEPASLVLAAAGRLKDETTGRSAAGDLSKECFFLPEDGAGVES